MNNASESEFILRFYEAKEESYFQSYYNAIYPQAFKIAFYICNNKDDAEDICQHSFLTLYRNNEKCVALETKDFAKIRSWFLSIVYNTSKMYVRSKINRTNREKTVANKNSKSSQKNESYENEETLRLVKNAIEGLSENYRVPILLKFNDGLDYQEISEVLQLKPEALRNRISRGIQKIKKALQGKDLDNKKIMASIAICGYLNLPKQIAPPAFLASSESTRLAFAGSIGSKSVFAKLAGILATIVAVGTLTYFSSNLFDSNISAISSIKSAAESEESPLKEIEWDLSQGNLNGIEVFQGKFTFKEKYFFSEGDKETVIGIPYTNGKPFVLQLNVAICQPKNASNVNFGIHPIYKFNNDYYLPNETHRFDYYGKLDPRRLPALGDYYLNHKTMKMYFFKDLIFSEYNGKLNRVSTITAEIRALPEAKLGVILTSICVDKIQLSEVSESQAEKITKKLLKKVEDTEKK